MARGTREGPKVHGGWPGVTGLPRYFNPRRNRLPPIIHPLRTLSFGEMRFPVLKDVSISLLETYVKQVRTMLPPSSCASDPLAGVLDAFDHLDSRSNPTRGWVRIL